MRQTIWEWKQKLYTEAEADKKPIVPLSKLKSIYGEVPTLPQSGQFIELLVSHLYSFLVANDRYISILF